MNTQAPPRRMSPLSALFFSFAAVAISLIGTVLVLGVYGISVVDQKASQVLNVAGHTIESLPDLIEAVGPATSELLGDRAPAYKEHIKIEAAFVTDEEGRYTRPALTITNNGDQVVTLMSVRVAALNSSGVPVENWTDVVATPLGVDDWPGQLHPGDTRHFLMRRWSRGKIAAGETLTPSVETTELRIASPSAGSAEIGRLQNTAERIEAIAGSH